MQSAAIRAQEVNPAKLVMLYRRQFDLSRRPERSLRQYNVAGRKCRDLHHAVARVDQLGTTVRMR